MDIYTLDDQFRRTEIIDVFESLVWTDRFNDIGDFELVLNSTQNNRKILKRGTRLAIPNSYRVMEVDTIEDKDDEEGRPILTVSGLSLEYILKHRSAVCYIGAPPKVRQPLAHIKDIVDRICRLGGGVTSQDILPYLQSGTILSLGDIAAPATTAEYDTANDDRSLYEAVSEVAQAYDLGFRFVRTGDDSKLYFEVYTGFNRTSSQSTNSPVLLATNLDNLKSTNYLSSQRDYRNVCLAINEQGFEWVVSPNVDSPPTGFNRRVITVKAEELKKDGGGDPTAAEITAHLQKIAYDELNKIENRAVSAMDGELTDVSGYIYEQDYRVGDLMEIRNDDGILTTMRVVEQIITSDSEGDRSFPTLSSNQTIEPGTWMHYTWDVEWEDAEGTWSSV